MTESQPNSVPPRRAGRLTILLATIAVLVVAGAAGIYGIGGLQRNAGGDPVCRPAVALAQQLKPLVRGEVAAVTMASSPLRLPDLAFTDGAGEPKKLSDFRGRTVLVNLWATWCVPCRKEMPALDDLQAQLGSERFEVVAINIDTRDPAKPRKFLDEEKLTRLSYFADPTAKVFQDLKSVGRALGMPTSVLVDGNGCEIGTIAGPAEWNSADATTLIKAAVKPIAAGRK
ncbi:thiol-disulfide isomerase/thioredoxin [Rhodopseudomonas thermotolerans]|uniref:Thiol-disulfide isomerase/thioredoxin n=2 Tax=Rhodopseudomonas TaxID=1073 RepID=A0A336JXQ4_9BRAD|nr:MULTISPECIES: TlpA disulfide reductase family protein [Rhodopseudomonas]RED22775.1 thiol-disulfide isomerase/thioredoxin [Rhodopseudomonas pentothenatexigens]REF88742.1 thiol-disulfide isomerase/thioredoxin [Rhodopseudomonas thermotolerans]SSW93493.1 thiol-disulfide isomerase/thioredoxin [Rhodopseudomonas pentothenatexigens]